MGAGLEPVTKCHRRPLGSGPQEPGSPVPILGQDKPLTCTSQVTPGPGCEGAEAGSDPGGPIRPVSPTASPPPRGAVPPTHLSVRSLWSLPYGHSLPSEGVR